MPGGVACAYRVAEIEINRPKVTAGSEVGDVWIRVVLQVVEQDPDGTIRSVTGQDVLLYRKVSDLAVATQVISGVNDPVTQQPLTASVAGLTYLIEAAVARWTAEDHPGATWDPVSGRMIVPHGE